MNLLEIGYSENPGAISEWTLEPVHLSAVNLIVGRNAAGKTRILSTIHKLAEILRVGALPPANAIWDAEWQDGAQYRYHLAVREGRVAAESLRVGEETKLERGTGGIGKIWTEKLGAFLDFQTPEEFPAARARHDEIQHPYLNPLEHWARSVHYYPFAALGRAFSAESAVEAFFAGAEAAHFGAEAKAAIQRIGYDIEEIGLMQNPKARDASSPRALELFVKEKRLKTITRQGAMSQGMLRSIALIIHLQRLAFSHCPALILIDDFGEGLDFEKSSALVEFVLERCRQSRFQLVMSTNERVVMNKLPLECWSVLQQEEGRTRVFNQVNSKERFEQFKFTGLSNFDFFSMDFGEEKLDG